jgi:Mrp family chromosome partitioning ATPase
VAAKQPVQSALRGKAFHRALQSLFILALLTSGGSLIFCDQSKGAVYWPNGSSKGNVSAGHETSFQYDEPIIAPDSELKRRFRAAQIQVKQLEAELRTDREQSVRESVWQTDRLNGQSQRLLRRNRRARQLAIAEVLHLRRTLTQIQAKAAKQSTTHPKSDAEQWTSVSIPLNTFVFGDTIFSLPDPPKTFSPEKTPPEKGVQNAALTGPSHPIAIKPALKARETSAQKPKNGREPGFVLIGWQGPPLSHQDQATVNLQKRLLAAEARVLILDAQQTELVQAHSDFSPQLAARQARQARLSETLARLKNDLLAMNLAFEKKPFTPNTVEETSVSPEEPRDIPPPPTKKRATEDTVSLPANTPDVTGILTDKTATAQPSAAWHPQEEITHLAKQIQRRLHRLIFKTEERLRPFVDSLPWWKLTLPLLGLLLGLGYFCFQRHQRTGGRHLIERHLPSACYSSLPWVPEKQWRYHRERQRLEVSTGLAPDFNTALEELADCLQAERLDGGERVLLACSLQDSGGQASLLANLALCLAEKGARVLLLDLDLQHPQLHEAFQQSLDYERGLPELLNWIAERRHIHTSEQWHALLAQKLSQFITPSELHENLDSLNAGCSVADSLTFVEDTGLGGIIQSVKLRYDWVILNSPAIVATQQAELEALSEWAEGLLVFVERGSSQGTIRQASEIIAQLDRSILATVVRSS